ncbi:MAG: hypothetical protein D6766_01970 [Verrucomicrobia bacterium]|nr:MAG: hypothetical protein D6766_01970 [Verrucomicrobiota bacterium]
MGTGAGVVWTGTDWLGPAAAAVALALASAWWSYRRAPAGFWTTVCVALKTFGVGLLAFCLLEPLRTGQRARPGANLFAVVADNSQGLQVHDEGDPLSRGERLRRLLDPQAGWLRQLEEDFAVRKLQFDTHLRTLADFAGLDFQGRASALLTSLQQLRERYKGRPLAGILVLTDGIATDETGPFDWPEDAPPVYPVVIGRPGSVRDLALRRTSVRETAFEDAPVTIEVEAEAIGLARRTVVAVLRGPDGRERERQTREVRSPAESLRFRFEFRPEAAGLAFHGVELVATAAASRDTNAVSEEATLLNNRAVVPVQRGRGPHRILYVAGRPNWEYKFLNRAVQADPEVQLVALIRVALREPKFAFLGRAGESGNPLFRGFGDQSREEVARYDQPVLVRLNTRDARELAGGFPATPEELFEYEAVILDDVEAAFFKADQLALLRRFVADRGGGLLMLGGAESFREGGYERTPVAELLPVYLDRVPRPAMPEGVRFELTPAGWLEPWTRLRETEAAERARLEAMPPFRVLNAVPEAKPAAQVLAVARDANDRAWPALVAHRFGRGRAAALLVGDLWRWGMRGPEARRDMERFWRQTLRWLVRDTARRVELLARPLADPPGSVRLEARVRTAAYEPEDEAAVWVTIQNVPYPGDTNAPLPALRLRAEPSSDEPGLFTVLHTAPRAGAFRAEATATNYLGALIGEAEAGWTVDPAAAEFRSLQPNLGLLETIARVSGGRVVEPAELDALVRELPTRGAPVMETWNRPLWHNPWVFLAALLAFVVEWGLRRAKGLP